MAIRPAGLFGARILQAIIVSAVLLLPGAAAGQTVFVDAFNVNADRLDTSNWTTELGNPSYIDHTQLRDWWTADGQQRSCNLNRLCVRDGRAQLRLDTYNPYPGLVLSLYGTHAKTIAMFRPSLTADVVLAVRMRLETLQAGLVHGVYFYGCPSSCAVDRDEIDIELVSNYLSGQAPSVLFNRYQGVDENDRGSPVYVALPAGFDVTASHEWKIRWGRTRLTYYVDNAPMFAVATDPWLRQMHADMIIWGPSSTRWPAAHHSSLAPEASPADSRTFITLVDRFEVREVAAFADVTFTPGAMTIQLAHVTELRDHIDALRSREGLAPFVWTDASPVAGQTIVRAQHLEDLRTAVIAVYAAVGADPPSFTDTSLASVVIKAVHITELRAAVMAIE